MTPPVELPKDARQGAAASLQTLLQTELDVEIGALEAEVLLDQIVRVVGPVFYNRALADARAVLAQKAEDMDEALYGLERQSALR